MSKYHEYKTGLPPTPGDIEGPFYLVGSPFRDTLCDSPDLHLSGKVMDTGGNPVSPAGGRVVLDFWQANKDGVYDEHGMGFRGKVVASFGDDGTTYHLHTTRPGDYQIADSPPDFRCSHIHVKVTAPGFKPLTTQLYFKDDKFNATDHWFDRRR